MESAAVRKPAPFPHHYSANLIWGGGSWGSLTTPFGVKLTGGPPPQFGGRVEWWSPEQLLLGSAALCLMTTFFAFAEREKLTILGYEGRAEGTLDKTAAGLVFTEITLFADIQVSPGDVEQATRILHAAKKHCIVSNSLKTAVELRGSVTPP